MGPIAGRRLRVLCLHGAGTSGNIFRHQVKLARWSRSVLDLMDLSFGDAPCPARITSIMEGKFWPPYYEWFTNNKDLTEFYGVESAFSYLVDYLKLHGPFDGLLGFSQGAFLAGALAGLQVKKNLLPYRIKFVIIIGGGVFRHKALAAAYETRIECPSLHMIGDKDFCRETGETLSMKFQDAVVLKHPHGHWVPSLDETNLEKFRSFLQQRLKERSMCGRSML